MTVSRAGSNPPTSRLNRSTPCETQTDPTASRAVRRSRARCQRLCRSATRSPPTTHGRPAQGAASRDARFAWNRKLCTSSGRNRRRRPASLAIACNGRRRLTPRHSHDTPASRMTSASRPGPPRQNTPTRQRAGSSRVASAVRARSAPPTSRSVITSARPTGRAGQGRGGCVDGQALAQARLHGTTRSWPRTAARSTPASRPPARR